jgi:hypothetical protein
VRRRESEQEKQQRDHREGEPGDAAEVEARGQVAQSQRAVEWPVGRHPGECRDERDQRDRDVDEEDRPPAERADQGAADR